MLKQFNKNITISLMIFCTITILLHSNSYAIGWTKTYGGKYDEYGYSVQQTSDGGFIIAGTTKSFGSGCSDVYLIRTNSSGDIAVAEDSVPLISSKFELLQNPATDFVTILYSFPSSNQASVNIYNLSGRLVQTFLIPFYSYRMKLDLKDSGNRQLPSGIYFLTLTAEDYKLTRKLTILQ